MPKKNRGFGFGSAKTLPMLYTSVVVVLFCKYASPSADTSICTLYTWPSGSSVEKSTGTCTLRISNGFKSFISLVATTFPSRLTTSGTSLISANDSL